MKNLNRDNYEPWALDYLEGTLSIEDRQLFESFLNLHPDIAKDLQGMEIITLTPPQDLEFPNKEKLLRSETKIRPLYWWVSSAAAAVLALVLVYNTMDSDTRVAPVNATMTHAEKESVPASGILSEIDESIITDFAAAENDLETSSNITNQKVVKPEVKLKRGLEIPVEAKQTETPVYLASNEVVTSPIESSESISTEERDLPKNYTEHRSYSYSAVSTIAMASMMIQVPNRQVVLNMNYREISPLPASKAARPILLTGMLPESWESRVDIVQTSKSLPKSLLPEIFTND